MNTVVVYLVKEFDLPQNPLLTSFKRIGRDPPSILEDHLIPIRVRGGRRGALQENDNQDILLATGMCRSRNDS